VDEPARVAVLGYAAPHSGNDRSVVTRSMSSFRCSVRHVWGERGRLIACMLAASAALEAGFAAPAAAAPVATCGKVLPPLSGAYLGASGLGSSELAAFERRAGRRLSWVAFSQPWSRGLAFPRQRILAIWRHGAVPYVLFLPTSTAYVPGRSAGGPERRYTLERIAAGDFDRQLTAWARAARALGVPLLLSFAADVNEDWGPWNGRWNGAGETEAYGDLDTPDGAERYRDAYRRLVRLFHSEGARNVSFVFSVDARPASAEWNAARLYYPGDAFVDWLAISDYGSLEPGAAVVPFARRLADSGVYASLARLSRRPVAVVAGTVDESALGKAAWIRDAFRALRSNRYARVKAAVWSAGSTATRVDAPVAALASFRAGVAGSRFSGRARFAGDCRPPPPARIFATPVRPGLIRVGWSPVRVASSYEIYRDGKLLAVTKRTTWLDATAGQAQRHTYTVRAVDPGGRSV
jgi:hypothetical protein